jgi:hypothetical protein
MGSKTFREGLDSERKREHISLNWKVKIGENANY